MNSLSFFVPGRPVPGGSKRAFLIHQKGCPAGRRFNKGSCVCRPHTTVVDSAGQRNKDWRSAVVQFAYEACRDWACEQTPTQQKPILPIFFEAVEFYAHFWLPRPKTHYGKHGYMLPSAPPYHVIRPDVLKLARAVEDALTGIVWADDAIIVREHLEKDYADHNHATGVELYVCPRPELQPVLQLEDKEDERPKHTYTLRDPGQQNLSPANR